MDLILLERVFSYVTTDQMLQTLHNLETIIGYNQDTSSIENYFENFVDRVKNMSKGDEENKGIKISNFVNKILDFNLK